MSAGKSAYEIRASLLELSFKILSERHMAHNGSLSGECKILTSPTVEDVIAEAEKLNGFVSAKRAHE